MLLTAQALAAEDGASLPTSGKPDVGHDRDRAKALVLEAVKLAPDLVPAAALAGRLLGEAGETRKASRIIEAAWLVNPHPDLADAYAHLRPGSSARERLGRVETLAAKTPGNVEAALAVARAALDAQEFATAREALEPLAIVPTRRVAALMAELEEMEHGDEGRAREWMTRALNARRDPAWTADGFVSERWQPVSPVTGRLDAFEWKDPLAGEQAGALIEAEQRGVFEVPHRAASAVCSLPHGTRAAANRGLGRGGRVVIRAAPASGELLCARGRGAHRVCSAFVARGAAIGGASAPWAQPHPGRDRAGGDPARPRARRSRA